MKGYIGFFLNINYNQVKLIISMYIIYQNVNCHTGGSNLIWNFDNSMPINYFIHFIIGSLLEVLSTYKFILISVLQQNFLRWVCNQRRNSETIKTQIKFEPTLYLKQHKSGIYLGLFQKIFFQFIENFSITSRDTVINSNKIKI